MINYIKFKQYNTIPKIYIENVIKLKKKTRSQVAIYSAI